MDFEESVVLSQINSKVSEEIPNIDMNDKKYSGQNQDGNQLVDNADQKSLLTEINKVQMDFEESVLLLSQINSKVSEEIPNIDMNDKKNQLEDNADQKRQIINEKIQMYRCNHIIKIKQQQEQTNDTNQMNIISKNQVWLQQCGSRSEQVELILSYLECYIELDQIDLDDQIILIKDLQLMQQENKIMYVYQIREKHEIQDQYLKEYDIQIKQELVNFIKSSCKSLYNSIQYIEQICSLKEYTFIQKINILYIYFSLILQQEKGFYFEFSKNFTYYIKFLKEIQIKGKLQIIQNESNYLILKGYQLCQKNNLLSYKLENRPEVLILFENDLSFDIKQLYTIEGVRIVEKAKLNGQSNKDQLKIFIYNVYYNFKDYIKNKEISKYELQSLFQTILHHSQFFYNHSQIQDPLDCIQINSFTNLQFKKVQFNRFNAMQSENEITQNKLSTKISIVNKILQFLDFQEITYYVQQPQNVEDLSEQQLNDFLLKQDIFSLESIEKLMIKCNLSKNQQNQFESKSQIEGQNQGTPSHPISTSHSQINNDNSNQVMQNNQEQQNMGRNILQTFENYEQHNQANSSQKQSSYNNHSSSPKNEQRLYQHYNNSIDTCLKEELVLQNNQNKQTLQPIYSKEQQKDSIENVQNIKNKNIIQNNIESQEVARIVTNPNQKEQVKQAQLNQNENRNKIQQEQQQKNDIQQHVIKEEISQIEVIVNEYLKEKEIIHQNFNLKI